MLKKRYVLYCGSMLCDPVTLKCGNTGKEVWVKFDERKLSDLYGVNLSECYIHWASMGKDVFPKDLRRLWPRPSGVYKE